MNVPGNRPQNALILQKRVAASRELLWDYVSTASGLACWQADVVQGDLSSGSFSLRWPSLGARLDLSVAELERGERILLRAGGTTLELRVEEGLVELTHGGLDTEDDFSGFESSWNTALALLELAAVRHPRKVRAVKWLFQKVPASAELLHFYFTDREALGTWLGTLDEELAYPKDYTLRLFGGELLTGTVLHSTRDVCLHVAEWNHGAVSLRSLPGPEDSRIAALGVSTWESELPSAVTSSLEGALQRLSTITLSRES